MIITFAKQVLISNIISTTNRRIDMIMDGNKTDLSNYYIGENDMPWIEKTLIIADFQIRKVLQHLLKKEITHPNGSTLVYNITLSHPIQQTIIPQQIEEVLTEYVCQVWILSKTSNTSFNVSDLFTELKSISLLCEKRSQRMYYII